MIFILILVITISYFIAKKIYNNILNPIMIFVGVNILSIILSLLLKPEINYNFEFSFLVLIMFISFIIGTVLGTKRHVINQRLTATHYDKKNLLKIIIVFGLIYDFALLGYLNQLFSNYGLIEFFLKLNEVNAYVQSDAYETHWFSYIVPLGLPMVILCIFYLKYYNINGFVIIQTILSTLYCISPRRDNLFNLLLVIAIFFLSNIKYTKKIKISSKKIIKYSVIVLISLVVIMSYSQNLLKKNSEDNIELKIGSLPKTLNDTYLYIALNYPYSQKQNMKYESIPDIPFTASLRIPYLFINKFFNGKIEVDKQFELEFENIDNKYRTNTAPILYYFIVDFGFLFFLNFFCLGWLSQRAYYYLYSNNILKKIVGSLCFVLLLLSFRGYLFIYLSFFLNIAYTIILGLFIKRLQ